MSDRAPTPETPDLAAPARCRHETGPEWRP